MEIKIRNIDPLAVQRIDEQAKKNKLSRNAYLVKVLENLSVNEELAKQETKFAEVLEAVSTSLHIQAKEFNDLKETIYVINELRK